MATAMLAETLDNSQHSTWLIPESRSCTVHFNVILLSVPSCLCQVSALVLYEYHVAAVETVI
jgi:hypothetical protein